jgi:hypothetical protein
MPGPGHSQTDLPLSDTLSARSYLDLGHDDFQAQVQLVYRPAEYKPASTSNPSVSGGLIEAPGTSGPGPHLRPRLRPRPRPHPREPRPVHKDPETTESAAPGIKDPLGDHDRPVRKRGRPRLETAKDAAAIEVCHYSSSPRFRGRGSLMGDEHGNGARG